jgi:hypothetical protein
MPFEQGACVLGFNKKCGITDPATGRDVCCPNRDIHITPTKTMFDIFGAWSDNEDNNTARVVKFGVYENFGYTIRPGTFSTPDSSIVMLDSMAAPADMMFPHPALVLGSIVNIAFESIPSKAFEVFFSRIQSPTLNKQCGNDILYASTHMSVFYYDSPTRRWVSVPIAGDDSTGSFLYDAAASVATATIPARVAIRNNLSVFLAVMMGIPTMPLDQHIQTQFISPPVGLRKSDMYKEGWSLPYTNSLGCNYLLPVPANSSEFTELQQGLVFIGSPGVVKLEQQPTSIYQVSIYVDPTLLAAASSTTGSRRLLEQSSGTQPVQVYFYNNGVWLPVPGCTFNFTSSSSECAIVPAFFQMYGLYVTISNVANASSSLYATVQAEQTRATWLEAQDLATLQALFAGLQVPAATTTRPATTSHMTATTTPPPPPVYTPPLSDNFLVGIVVACIFLLVIVPSGFVGWRYYYVRVPRWTRGMNRVMHSNYAQFYDSVPSTDDLGCGSIPELRASVGGFMDAAAAAMHRVN